MEFVGSFDLEYYVFASYKIIMYKRDLEFCKK